MRRTSTWRASTTTPSRASHSTARRPAAPALRRRLRARTASPLSADGRSRLRHLPGDERAARARRDAGAARDRRRSPGPRRARIAVGGDGNVYVTHFITKEPNHDGHVSEVDPVGRHGDARVRHPARLRDLRDARRAGRASPTCSRAVAVARRARRRAGSALGRRHAAQRAPQGALLAQPLLPGPAGQRRCFPTSTSSRIRRARVDAAHRNIYKAGLPRHRPRGDLEDRPRERDAAWRVSTSRAAAQIAGARLLARRQRRLRRRPCWRTASTRSAPARGDGGNAASLFGAGERRGSGRRRRRRRRARGDRRATSRPRTRTSSPPQARLVPTGGMNPLDAGTLAPVDTGLEFTVATGLMRGVPDGVGTTPDRAWRSRPTATRAYVANYLARNVTVVHAATPAGFRCQAAPASAVRDASRVRRRRRVHAARAGRRAEHRRRSAAAARSSTARSLFTTAARDAAGADGPVPPWNALGTDGSDEPGRGDEHGARRRVARRARPATPTSAGKDGRTWDFSQFGSSLRNTMDLRGRAAFAPGTVQQRRDGVAARPTPSAARSAPARRCLNDPAFIPPNIPAPYRDALLQPDGLDPLERRPRRGRGLRVHLPRAARRQRLRRQGGQARDLRGRAGHPPLHDRSRADRPRAPTSRPMPNRDAHRAARSPRATSSTA